MRYFQIGICAVTLLIVATPALAVNKCTGADGKVSFQDAPCIGKSESVIIKPASGTGRSAELPMAGASAAVRLTEADRINANVDASIKARRLADVQNIYHPQSMANVNLHRRACAKEQADLKDGQFRYVQNLYGKTHAAQMASEMAAASARCDLKDRELKEQSDALKAECVKLGGCNGVP